ncbi:PorV/PorQ family protein, partial [candidate division WOR-3 bacterium]|nr:PorV/PorQ family protein [candidate division WOR-3 bacterium]
MPPAPEVNADSPPGACPQILLDSGRHGTTIPQTDCGPAKPAKRRPCRKTPDRAVTTTLLVLSVLLSAHHSDTVLACPFLAIWPTARATALAGAVTALADEPDEVWANPAGLAFQRGTGFAASHADWLPDLLEAMDHAYASVRHALRRPVLGGRRAALACDVNYFSLGMFDVVEPEFDPPHIWRGALGLSAGISIARNLAGGIAARVVHSQELCYWAWRGMPELGIDLGGTSTTFAMDIGVLWKPLPRLSAGLALAALGPDMSYPTLRYSAPLPTTLRSGLCWTALDASRLRLCVLGEFDKLLPGTFSAAV